jgi:hypothetical protein
MGFPAKQSQQSFTFPASVGGINTLSALMGMEVTDCIQAHNCMPSEYGLRLRRGYQEWATIPTGKEIRSIIPYEGQDVLASEDRCWAVTEDGIYNVTLKGDHNPDLDQAFATQSDAAGFGTSVEFTNDTSERFLFYADEENGLFEYSEGTGLWTVPTIVGPDVTNVAFVTTWKNRLWLIERSSGDAWYLDPDSKSDNATEFTFGSKFQHGGDLIGIWNWTIDGGDGIDDFLVAVGRGGDVLVYQGVDPNVAAGSPGGFGLVGSYFIGELPESRRVAAEYGGQLYILSTFGVISVSDLLQGVAPLDPGKTPSAKINRGLRDLVEQGKDDRQWSLNIYPSDGFLQIVMPYDFTKPSLAAQFNQNLMTTAWGQWRNVPVNCANPWSGKYMMGSHDGIVWQYEGELDGTTLPGPELWADVLSSAGPEWSQPLAEQYACDGTQVAQTAYLVETGVVATPGVKYDVTYTITNWVAGEHAMQYGDGATPAISTFASGDGIFSGTITIPADSTSSLAGVVGDADFQGTFSLVSLRESSILGQAIDFDVLTSFQPPGGDHSTYVRVGHIRPITVSSGAVNITVKAVYDYQIGARPPPPPPAPTVEGAIWDTDLWDFGVWGFGVDAISRPFGALGVGRTVAISMRGVAANRMTFVGWDISFTQGGFL